MKAQNISKNFSADLSVVASKHTRQIFNWAQVTENITCSTGNGNTQGIHWWSGVKSPMNGKQAWDDTMTLEFYVVNQHDNYGFVNWLVGTGPRYVGSISAGSKTYSVYRKWGVVSKRANGSTYTHEALWAIGGGNPIPASAVVGACRNKNYITNVNWWIQYWYRFIEVYNSTGQVKTGTSYWWFN